MATNIPMQLPPNCIDLTTPEADQWKVMSFKEELAFIKDPAMLGIAAWLIAKLPDYFFHVAASSTGKYHPSYTQGDGGLLRHTKSAVRIAIELLRLEMYQFMEPHYDEILIALMIHDGWKHGPQTEDGSYREFTDQSHARICADWIKGLSMQIPQFDRVLNEIASLVHTHMGQWNINSHTGEVFAPKPMAPEQCFVHLCDYLASRKMLEVNFDVQFGK